MCKHGLFFGLTPTKQGHDAIFVCVDKLSKMAHFMATTTTVTAEETARLFRDHVYKLLPPFQNKSYVTLNLWD
jgi:hypothetical protein